jgi:chemotaxis protein methyltransferase CheR
LSSETGIHLNDGKKALLVARLGRRLAALGLTSYGDYSKLVARDRRERARMIEALCTHETSFFRHPAQFRALKEYAIPAWREDAARRKRPRSLRAWSAGCSNGAEAHSLAMLLLSELTGWNIEILGTDLSSRIVRDAENGVWPIEKADQIPSEFLRRYMCRGVGAREGWMRAGSYLRAVTRFETLNLNDATWTLEGRFDLILCRNVLIYFHPTARVRTLRRITERLLPDGLLLLGPGEAPGLDSTQLRVVAPTIYVRRQDQPARADGTLPRPPS